MIPLAHAFSVEFLHFDNIWFSILCLQIIMILDTHLHKKTAVIQIILYLVSSLFLAKKETESKSPNFLGACLKL